MKILEVEQGSSEWLSFREGKRTGTSIGKLFAKSRKTGELYDTEKPLVTLYQKVAERLAEGTGDDDGLESSRERGKELEAEAITCAEEKVTCFEFIGEFNVEINHFDFAFGVKCNGISAVCIADFE